MQVLSRFLGKRPPSPALLLDAAKDSAAVSIRGDMSLHLNIAPPNTSGRRERSQAAVIVVDVRHNRPFDGSLRSMIAEQVLQSVEKALKDCIRSSDSVVRTADSQFAILLNQVTVADDVSRTMGRILLALENGEGPVSAHPESGQALRMQT